MRGATRAPSAHLKTLRLLAFVVGSVMTDACVVDDRGPPDLLVVRTIPAEGEVHPADAPIRIEFDRYLESGQRWSTLVEFGSGDAVLGAELGYDPVGPGLVAVPSLELRPGLEYFVRVLADSTEGDGGAMLAEDFELTFVAGPARGPRRRAPPIDFDRDIQPIFERSCGCHGPPRDEFPVLTPGAVIGIPSRRNPDLAVVSAGRPLDSHLVLKILREHPRASGQRMPPQHALPPTEQRDIVSWVEQLGR